MLYLAYFPAIALITTSTATGFPVELFSQGPRRSLSVSRNVTHYPDRENTCHHALTQLYADLLLCNGFAEEAEFWYVRCQKAVRDCRELTRWTSCRSAAWQALWRARPGIALSCFLHMLDEATTPAHGVTEALAGAALSLYAAGCSADAFSMLQRAADSLPVLPHDQQRRWRAVIEMLDRDIQVQNVIRAGSAFDSHAYWRSSCEFEKVAPLRKPDQAEQHESYLPVILFERSIYLDALYRLSSGSHEAVDAVSAHLHWSESCGVPEYPEFVRSECALASLNGNHHELAERLVSPLERELARTVHARLPFGRSKLELLYCIAKTHELQGRVKESLHFYSAYALCAMQQLRMEATSMAAVSSQLRRHSGRLDSVSARLPVKYRKAYWYLIAHLDRRRLTVSEIAAEAGVTERALQAVFRAHLGVSPSELIRQQRRQRQNEATFRA